MKFNTTNVIIGAVVIAIVLYFLKSSSEGFTPSDDAFEKTLIGAGASFGIGIIIVVGFFVLYSRSSSV